MKEQSLVDYLVDVSRFTKSIDTSMARRMIVERQVKVNGDVITDPAFRLPFESGFVVETPNDKTDETKKAAPSPGLVRYDSPD